MEDCERTGERFNLGTYLRARSLCRQMVEEIIAQVQPGMTEIEGQALIKEVFGKHGVQKNWHPSKFRIGPDTMKSFRELPDSSLVCRTGDLCFLDVGPVIDDHEADFGRTFQIGSEPASRIGMIISACEKVFQETSTVWKTQGLTGVELYNFAEEKAKSYGYQLNRKMAGHRLGDFPHQIFSQQRLTEFKSKPLENLWILEIHIVDPVNQRGAFFEDILI